MDIEKVVQEAIEGVTKKQEKRKRIIRKTKKIVRNNIRNITRT